MSLMQMENNTATPRCEVASIPVDCLTLQEALHAATSAIHSRSGAKPYLIMGPNAQLVTLAQRNLRFAEALHASALNICDGVSVLLALRLLGHSVPERVTGGDMMEHLCAEAAQHGWSVFFLGGLPEAARLCAENLKQRYPRLTIAGTYCPPRGFEKNPTESAQVRRLISEAHPDLLFVALGAPKQEVWMYENCLDLPVKASLAVGAAFDTQAGMRQRAPRWTHKLGVEWLYRLLQEPRRLWRRYIFGNPYFLYLVFRQILQNALHLQPKQRLQTHTFSIAQSASISVDTQL